MGYQVAVSGVQWAIDPESIGDVQLTLARFNAAIGDPAVVAGAIAAVTAKRERAAGSSTPGVAVIPIEGVLLPKAPAWAAEFGIGSTSGIGAAVRAAMRDRSVAAIVLAVDSPGGDVRGVEEAADAIAAAAGVKPTIAVIEYLGASAAYWLASQAREIVMPASAVAGAIGVITSRVDVTGLLEQHGIKVHVLTAGPHKGEGHPATVMSEAEEAATRVRLEGLYAAFLGGVARGRGVSAADVAAGFGGGRTFYGRDAVARGLANRIGSMGDVLTALLEAGAVVSGDQGFAGDPCVERATVAAELLRLRTSALVGV